MTSISVFGTEPRPATPDLRLNSRGGLEVVTGLEDVRQRVIEHLRYWRGEWYLDRAGGMPWREEIFTRPVSVALATSVITDEISRVSGVSAVRDPVAEIDPATRRLSYRARVATPFGEFQAAL